MSRFHEEDSIITRLFTADRYILDCPNTVFPSFLYLSSTKLMSKWSRAPWQLLEGHWVKHMGEF